MKLRCPFWPETLYSVHPYNMPVNIQTVGSHGSHVNGVHAVSLRCLCMSMRSLSHRVQISRSAEVPIWAAGLCYHILEIFHARYIIIDAQQVGEQGHHVVPMCGGWYWQPYTLGIGQFLCKHMHIKQPSQQKLWI